MTESFSTVLSNELKELDARRKAALGAAPPTMAASGPEPVEAFALARNLAGMGISGGGIRSATFNLGILQGLAERGLLPYFDYLSTVSGGGYIGCWLHGVIQRMHGGHPAAAAAQLSPEANPIPGPPADDPISFLRKYSNYLAPRLSIFSPDVWVIGSIWLRNMFLNQCVLAPFLAALLLLPAVLGLYHQAVNYEWHGPLVWGSYVTAGLLLAFAVLSMTVRLREIARSAFLLSRGRFASHRIERITVEAGGCAFTVLLAAILMGATRTKPSDWPALGQWLAVAGLFVLFSLFQWAGGFVECFRGVHKYKDLFLLHVLWMPAACTAVTGALLWAVLRLTSSWQYANTETGGDEGAWHALAWGPPLVVLAFGVGVSLLLGFMGSDYPDAAREWVSRLGASLLIYTTAWAAAFAFGVYAPLWVAMLFAVYGKTAMTASTAWITISGAGVLAGNSARTRAPNGSGNMFELLGKVAPPVFMAGYLVLISMGLDWGIRAFAGADAPGANWMQTIVANHWASLDGAMLVWSFTNWVAAAGVALLLLSFLFAGRININEFSMHHFYKNRLVRCYIGASRGRNRRPNSWTGFDPQDDIPLQDLRAGKGYYGPYAIINTALNINRGSELAKQERKAESFVYSPLYCGFVPERSDADEKKIAKTPHLHANSYRATREFSGRGGPHAGTAMAISGAAANPNMGYHTSGPLAFLLTVFNVRLGWWVGNPRWDGPAQRPGPMFALRYLLDELMAQTTDRSKFLNLSDGGHFDNLGLYELVRRRCRFILIGDGEQDPELTFGSLAGAIRKCRTDFGVEIDLDLHAIQETNGLSKAHCAVGTITYPEQDPAGVVPSYAMRNPDGRATGLLVYFKASLTGDEPEDVREYRSRFAEFPHQSTSDQFFTESQFESYRHLGLHIARAALEDVPRGATLPQAFAALARQWYPLPAVPEGAASRAADDYAKLLDKLKSDVDLRYLDSEIVPGLPAQPAPADPLVLRKGFFFMLDVIRLAESVYTDLDFREPQERENLRNAGWLTIFRYWSQQPNLKLAWQQARSTVNPLFREFFESL